MDHTYGKEVDAHPNDYIYAYDHICADPEFIGNRKDQIWRWTSEDRKKRSSKMWMKNYPTIIQSVLNRCHDINHRDKKGRTMMSFAAELGSKEIIDFLLEKGADCSFKDSDGSTPLHYAARYSQKDIVKFLLARGAPVDSCDNANRTPLILAVLSPEVLDIKIVQRLIEYKTDVDFPLPLGRRLLHHAAERGMLELVQCLVWGGCDLDPKDSRRNTPLLKASYASENGVVKYLIEAGADVEYCAQGGFTVLHRACGRGSLEVVQAIIKKGWNVNLKDPQNGDTGLHLAVTNGKRKIVNHLLKAGVDCTVENNCGRIALKDYIRNLEASAEVVKLFIENGAYFESDDYVWMWADGLKPVLNDRNICVQCILNGFNFGDLPKLYKIPAIAERLPSIEKLKISGNGDVADIITHSVMSDIQNYGYCNVFDLRPSVLQIACVRSIVKHYYG